MPRQLLCYARGHYSDWQAICVDLDIAVQGESFDEAYRLLIDAISLYQESVTDLSGADQRRLLNRQIPLRARAGIVARLLRGAMWDPNRDNHSQHLFNAPLITR